MAKTKTRPSMPLSGIIQKIEKLLARERITPADVGGLSEQEKTLLENKLSEILQGSKDTERDRFLEKIEPVMQEDTKNDLWERNHMLISNAIARHLQQHAVMPTKNQIARETGISRQTVAGHIKEYKEHPEFAAEIEQFKFMSHSVLGMVFKRASEGDIRAAKLYFEMVGSIGEQPAGAGNKLNAQNNYIQINNTILSQENLDSLTAEQLRQIENIISSRG
ncbi:hypothetical protein [Mucilaginibacter pedocola]|uniref:Uncharacterized protein n=1 Tax=Mucilaginibacter pedocola TaxID=1792845 RepID=A0A1S9PFB5_9SPHI|nr:hypothetical protein [Mucilaginibacter pedocola]OOQ59653.1 hypothetical protein BC343_05680 [Mucilaginibacter pedocola]